MRIAVFICEYPPYGGGGGVAAQAIVRELQTSHAFTVFTSAMRDCSTHEVDGNIEIVRVPSICRKRRTNATLLELLSYWPASEYRGNQYFRRTAFDLIHSHFVVPSAVGADRLAQRFGLPHIVSIHGGDVYDPSKTLSPHRVPVLRRMIGRILGRATRVVAQSRDMRDRVLKLYANDRAVDVIPLGVPSACGDASARGPIDGPGTRVVTVGRLVRRKAIESLLVVIAAIRRWSLPATELLVIGDGPERHGLEAFARQLRLDQAVTFMGFVDDATKARVLASADLYASTSMHEGFGLSLVEAMQNGLPIVAYDTGGHLDFVVHGLHGLIVPGGALAAFAAAVVRGLTDAEFRKRCRDHGPVAAGALSVSACAEKYHALYERAVTARGGA